MVEQGALPPMKPFTDFWLKNIGSLGSVVIKTTPTYIHFSHATLPIALLSNATREQS